MYTFNEYAKNIDDITKNNFKDVLLPKQKQYTFKKNFNISFRNCWLFPSDSGVTEKKYSQIFKTDKNIKSLSLNVPCIYTRLDAVNSGGICLTIKFAGTCIVSRKYMTSEFFFTGQKSSEHVLIFHNNGIYKKTTRGTYLPLSIKTLNQIYKSAEEYLKDNNILPVIFQRIADIYAMNGSYILKDALVICNNSEYQNLFIPTTFNECMDEKSIITYLSKKYPHKKNWGKYNINVLYATYKSQRLLCKEDKNKLLDCTDKRLINGISKMQYRVSNYIRSRKHNVEYNVCNNYATVVTNFFAIKFHIRREDRNRIAIINDYIREVLSEKKKIRLSGLTEERINEIHQQRIDEELRRQEAEREQRLAKTKVHVPRNSKFNNLRKLLPNNFEWIKGKRRLMKEQIAQHNCVFSYSNLINKDECAIYHYEHENGEKYTIEFNEKNGQYYVRQMFLACNQTGSSEAYEYVEKLLSTCSQ